MDEVGFKPGNRKNWIKIDNNNQFYNQEAQLNPANVNVVRKTEHIISVEIENYSNNDFPEYVNNSMILRAYIENDDKKELINPKEYIIIKTGLIINIPNGYQGYIINNSGDFELINSNKNVEILVPIKNYSSEVNTVKYGDIIGQLIITPVINNLSIKLIEIKNNKKIVSWDDNQ